MRFEYTRRFLKEYQKTTPDIKQAFNERLQLFSSDQFSPLLHNHSLAGEYRGYRSINITGDWRAIFKSIDDGVRIIFLTIGTHSQLYKK